MLYVIIIAFLLAQLQVLQADEFPSLLEHLEVTWGNAIITSKLNARQTMSIDGQVPSFLLCGPFKTSGKDGDCRLKYRYTYHPSPGSTYSGTGKQTSQFSPYFSLGYSSVTAKLISTINETYSCMSFETTLSDFVNLYKKTELNSYSNSYDISYTCQTSSPEPTKGAGTSRIIILVAVALFIFYGAWFIAHKCGERKNGQDVQNSEIYEANISGLVGEHAPAGGPSSKTTYHKTGTGVYWQKEWTF